MYLSKVSNEREKVANCINNYQGLSRDHEETTPPLGAGVTVSNMARKGAHMLGMYTPLLSG